MMNDNLLQIRRPNLAVPHMPVASDYIGILRSTLDSHLTNGRAQKSNMMLTLHKADNVKSNKKRLNC